VQREHVGDVDLVVPFVEGGGGGGEGRGERGGGVDEAGDGHGGVCWEGWQ